MKPWIAVSIWLALGLAPVWATETSCSPKKLDTTLFGVALEDSRSALARLGKDWETQRSDLQLESALFQSQDGKQTLTVFIQPDGGSDYAIAQFDLRLRQTGEKHRRLPEGLLKTGSGIRLGLRMGEIVARLGVCFTETTTASKRRILHYGVETAQGASFLQRYNMPAYKADYEFENGRLVHFRFGLEQP
ncbi:hypothetical protein [Lichenifustis flavocetrariae]|nr:hypothetical protein [Lichenifustis flavocetrariae]